MISLIFHGISLEFPWNNSRGFPLFKTLAENARNLFGARSLGRVAIANINGWEFQPKFQPKSWWWFPSFSLRFPKVPQSQTEFFRVLEDDFPDFHVFFCDFLGEPAANLQGCSPSKKSVGRRSFPYGKAYFQEFLLLFSERASLVLESGINVTKQIYKITPTLYLEPKWPLFWLEKALFWGVDLQK